MCTVTLEYDKNNALARHKLSVLLATGLFQCKEENTVVPSTEELNNHREIRDAVLLHSRKTMSHVISRYV